VAGISSIGSNPAYTLNSTVYSILNDAEKLSSGSALTSAAANPSGLAIYNSLEAQASGFDQGSENAQDALNATNVAEGAAQSITGILSNLNNTAIEAASDLNSPTDNAILQATATQQIQQINTIAQNTNFNGINLLTGNYAGTTPATPASAQVTNNDTALSTGQNIVNTAAGVTVPAATPGETIGVSISGGSAQVTVTNSATGAVTNVGSFASGASVTAGGVTFQLGTFGTNDTGSATIQVTGATQFSAGNSATVQTGATEGATTQLNFADLTSSSLGVSNLSFASTANAENAIGQISTGLTSVLSAQAQLGAQATSLQNQINANNIASTNLTASASAIGDTNVPNTVDNLNQNTTQNLISLAVLHQTNATAGFLTGLLDSAA
jgi:flagellin